MFALLNLGLICYPHVPMMIMRHDRLSITSRMEPKDFRSWVCCGWFVALNYLTEMKSMLREDSPCPENGQCSVIDVTVSIHGLRSYLGRQYPEVWFSKTDNNSLTMLSWLEVPVISRLLSLPTAQAKGNCKDSSEGASE